MLAITQEQHLDVKQKAVGEIRTLVIDIQQRIQLA
jgi:hypothetical protein